MKLHRIAATDAHAWTLAPVVFHRIERFCSAYPTEFDAHAMVNQVKMLFMAESPLLGLWAADDADGLVHGHMLAMYDPGRRIAFIYQQEVDKDVPTAIRDECTDALVAWGTACGARALEAVTWHNPRFLARRGFHVYRTIVRRSLIDG